MESKYSVLNAIKSNNGWTVVNEDEFEKHRQRAIKSDPYDFSYRTIIDRAVTMSHREWLAWNNERVQREWQTFFENYDLLLTPVAASAAFPHDHAGERADRTIPVNNGQEPGVDQLFWAGLPVSFIYLPLQHPLGSPVLGYRGLQIIGPYMQDLTTIHFLNLSKHI